MNDDEAKRLELVRVQTEMGDLPRYNALFLLDLIAKRDAREQKILLQLKKIAAHEFERGVCSWHCVEDIIAAAKAAVETATK